MCTHLSKEFIQPFCSRVGEEVALYCSKYLPDIIKEQKTYKDGKLQKVRSHASPPSWPVLNKFDRFDRSSLVCLSINVVTISIV